MKFLGIEDFASCVNQGFDVSIGSTSTPMSLVDIRELKVHVFPGMFRSPFALVFKSESAVVLPQKIYSMNNKTLGNIDIFISPIGREKDGFIYEAIFN